MKIYLFRHGETDWNKTRRLQGQSDIPLNAFGRELAKKTAEALESEAISFDRAFSSPLDRAVETARILLGGKNVPFMTDSRLMEINFGACEGWEFDKAKKDPSHPLHNFFCHPEQYIPPSGAESFQDAASRGAAFLQEQILPLEHVCRTVLIVAHGAFNRNILNTILDVPLEHFWQIGLPNCAASIISLENGQLRILEESRVYYGEPVNGRP